MYSKISPPSKPQKLVPGISVGSIFFTKLERTSLSEKMWFAPGSKRPHQVLYTKKSPGRYMFSLPGDNPAQTNIQIKIRAAKATLSEYMIPR